MLKAILISSFLATVLTFISAAETTGQTATWVELGKPAIVSCPLEKPGILKLCHWTRLDPTGKNNFNMSIIPPPTTVHDDNYVHVLNAEDECGIVIRNVSKVDISFWECLTGLNNENRVQRTSIQLLKAVKPTFPIIEHKRLLNSLIDDTVAKGKNILNLKCCSEYGEPKPQLIFYKGDKKIPDLKDDGYEDGPKYCVEWENATFTWEDDGKEVRCEQTHQTLSQEQKDSQIINIFYAPELVDAHIFTLNMFFVSSNPKPEVIAIFKETNQTIDETLNFNIGVSTDHINAWNITSKINTTGLPIDTTMIIRIVNPYGHLVIEIPSRLLNPQGTHTLGVDINKTQRQSGTGLFVVELMIGLALGLGFCIFLYIILVKWNGTDYLRRNWTDMKVRIFARNQDQMGTRLA